MKRFNRIMKSVLCMFLLFGTFHSLSSLPASAASRSPAVRATRPIPVVQPFMVYLSPSAQPWNPYCDGSGGEEYHMRLVANQVSYFLYQYGIHSIIGAPHSGARSRQRSEIVTRVKQAKANQCSLYLAIHSNAKDGGPKVNGTTIFYPSASVPSHRFADIVKDNFIYPDKDSISTDTKDALWEMWMPPMPHALIETAYHDNPEDVQWIESNTREIGKSIADCIAMYSYVPVSVSMDQKTASIKVGRTHDLTAKVTLIDNEISNNLTVWSSSNEKVAKVNNGTVLGVSRGTAVITARTSNWIQAKCTVRVY